MCIRAKMSDADATTSPSSSSTTGTLFAFGVGYVALGLAATLQRRGWTVCGTVRDADKAAALCARGITAWSWRPDDDEPLPREAQAALAGATHVLISTPPNGDFDRDPILASPSAVAALTARPRAQQKQPRWIGYLSSTGVYGNAAGEWVDETTAPAPVTAKAKARLSAEKNWIAFCENDALASLCVFRLGGIYGPGVGRSVLDAAAMTAMTAAAHTTSSRFSPPDTEVKRSARETRRFTSRIHVADIVAVLVASMSITPQTSRCYNVVDDCPAPRSAALRFATALLSAAKDGPEALALVAADASFAADALAAMRPATLGADTPTSGGEEKRVRNTAVKQHLGVRLAHGDYRSGLFAIVTGDATPF